MRAAAAAMTAMAKDANVVYEVFVGQDFID